MEGLKKQDCGSSLREIHCCCAFPRINILTHGAGKKQARSMHCHSHGDLRCVLGAVADETDLNAGDSISFLLQLELNQAVVY